LISTGVPPQTPLRELTLPRPCNWIQGVLLLNEGRGNKGKRKTEEKKEEKKRKERGKCKRTGKKKGKRREKRERGGCTNS